MRKPTTTVWSLLRKVGNKLFPYCYTHGRYHSCDADRQYALANYEKAARKVTNQWAKGLISDREFALKMYELSLKEG